MVQQTGQVTVSRRQASVTMDDWWAGLGLTPIDRTRSSWRAHLHAAPPSGQQRHCCELFNAVQYLLPVEWGPESWLRPLARPACGLVVFLSTDEGARYSHKKGARLFYSAVSCGLHRSTDRRVINQSTVTARKNDE